MHRTIPTVVVTAATVLVAGAWAATSATSATTRATSTATAARTSTPTHKKATRPTVSKTVARTYAGPSEDMRWGPVQVTIVVKGKRIIDIQASAPTERDRSAFINSQAIPMLRQEVLRVQSAAIDLVSGATMTSEAYDASLQAAIAGAHKAYAL